MITKILMAPFRCVYAYAVDAYNKARGLHKPFSDQVADATTCVTCPMRLEDSCSICGCTIMRKAVLINAECPQGYWEKRRKLDSEFDSGNLSEESYFEQLENLYS